MRKPAVNQADDRPNREAVRRAPQHATAGSYCAGITGVGNLRKTGAGTAQLLSESSFTGSTFVEQGLLVSLVADALGSTSFVGRLILNGIVWSAKIEVPAAGVQSTPPDLTTFGAGSLEPQPWPRKDGATDPKTAPGKTGSSASGGR